MSDTICPVTDTVGAAPSRAAGSSRLLQRTDIDGVPTFFVESPQTPFAVLSFRVGQADEGLPTHGWTHLLEHLAMHTIHCARSEANASVDVWTTQFHIRGEPDELVDFLHRLCEFLREPGFGALEHERDILAAESRRRTTSPLSQHLDYRYGARGPGLLGYAELGLHTASGPELSSWAARFFTAGNASLALSCPPIPGLRLDLPQGRLQPIPDHRPILPTTTPAHAQAATPETAVSGTLTQSWLAPLVGSVLSEAINRELRHEQRASYATTPAITRVDQSRLLLLLASDIAPERSRDAVDLLSTVLERFTDQVQRDPAGITWVRDRMVRQLRDDPIGSWQATSASLGILRGEDPIDESSLLQMLEGLSVADVLDQVSAFCDSALFTSQAGAASATTLPFTSGSPQIQPSPEADVYRAVLAPADGGVLYLSNDSLVYTNKTQHHGTVAVDTVDAAALLVYPDSAAEIVSRHGTSLMVRPTRWRQGDLIIERLQQLVPADRHIPMPDHGLPAIGKVPRRTWAMAQIGWLAQRHPRLLGIGLPSFLIALMFGMSLIAHPPWKERTTVTTQVLERAVNTYVAGAMNLRETSTDCHGAQPRVREVVQCVVSWDGNQALQVTVSPVDLDGSLRVLGSQPLAPSSTPLP